MLTKIRDWNELWVQLLHSELKCWKLTLPWLQLDLLDCNTVTLKYFTFSERSDNPRQTCYLSASRQNLNFKSSDNLRYGQNKSCKQSNENKNVSRLNCMQKIFIKVFHFEEYFLLEFKLHYVAVNQTTRNLRQNTINHNWKLFSEFKASLKCFSRFQGVPSKDGNENVEQPLTALT